jgi:hypothetical protein
MNSPLSVGAAVAVGSGLAVAGRLSVSVAVGNDAAVSVGMGVEEGSVAPVQAAAATTIKVASENASRLFPVDFNRRIRFWLSEWAGLSKRASL